MARKGTWFSPSLIGDDHGPVTDRARGVGALACGIASVLECFDDVAEIERIIHPLRMTPPIGEFDAEGSVLTFERVTGLAGRRARRFS